MLAHECLQNMACLVSAKRLRMMVDQGLGCRRTWCWGASATELCLCRVHPLTRLAASSPIGAACGPTNFTCAAEILWQPVLQPGNGPCHEQKDRISYVTYWLAA